VPSAETLILFSLSALALLVLPGPAVFYIVTRSIGQGRRAGLVSVLGIHSGSAVHVVGATIGISAILASSAIAFTAVKLLGAAYLVTLGVRRLMDRSPDTSVEPQGNRSSMRTIYRHGVVVNILNPKTALFFLALLPQFVAPARGPVALQSLVLGCCFIGLGLCTDSAYALLAGTFGDRLRVNKRLVRETNRLSGIAFIGLGITAAATGHMARQPAA
jgi:threonine/homoserine/homoserine lactone efflux protein